jgi:[histone H3]-lysine79 N-trimethyltransferase
MFCKTLTSLNQIFMDMPVLTSWNSQHYFRLLEECYNRCIKPNLQLLKLVGKMKNRNEVYGELLPVLLDKIFGETCLGRESTFLDLGSGVGNAVAQAALTCGCNAFGIEIRPGPSELAEDMLGQLAIRSQLWGIPVGKMSVFCGDMLKSRMIYMLVGKADVILVNNRVFEPDCEFAIWFECNIVFKNIAVNEKVKILLQHTKPGAFVVSLESFQQSGMSRRGVIRGSCEEAKFEITQQRYPEGSVSWSSSAGAYYLHRALN